MEAVKSTKNDELDTDLHGKHLPAILWRFLPKWCSGFYVVIKWVIVIFLPENSNVGVEKLILKLVSSLKYKLEKRHKKWETWVRSDIS